MGGPDSGQVSRRLVSVEVALARGPRNWGQSSARAPVARARKRARKRKKLRAMFAGEIKAVEFVFAAGVKEAVGEGGKGAGAVRDGLDAGSRGEGGGRSGRTDQFAPLGENEELILGQDERSGADRIVAPADLTGFEIDATKRGRG